MTILSKRAILSAYDHEQRRRGFVGLVSTVFNLIRAVVGVLEQIVISVVKVSRWLYDRIRL